MSAASAIRLSEIVSSLSYALDISEGHPTGHCVRACWIGFHIGRELGLGSAELGELYYTILLKDVGCSSNAARICELYLADDIALKHDFQLVGDSMPEILRFVFTRTGLNASLSDRLRALLNIAKNGTKIADELFSARCQAGASIVRQMRFPEAVATGVYDLDERWDGAGRPNKRSGADISLYGRIALVSQIVDVFYASAGKASALAAIGARSGSWLDPTLVQACNRAAVRYPEFWTMLDSPELGIAVASLLPAEQSQDVDDDYLDDIAGAFAQVVDAKSPYTRGHSDRVAIFSDVIAGQMGWSPSSRRRLRRAALLHDLGKLGVSNQILDKPGSLSAAEIKAMRHHPALGAQILSRIGVFEELARVAGAHHERLDGKGYPNGLRGDAIDPGTRIVTVADIFDALTADRPYRAALSEPEALELMRKQRGTAIDPDCFEALETAVRQIPRNGAASFVA